MGGCRHGRTSSSHKTPWNELKEKDITLYPVQTPIDAGRAQIGPLDPAESDQALALLAEALVDTPNHVAAFGDDPRVRLLRLHRLLDHHRALVQWEALVARDGAGKILGLLTLVKPGMCRPAPAEVAAASGCTHAFDPEVASALATWSGIWKVRDPSQPHWHCGIPAVAAGVDRAGVGSCLLGVFCAQLDAGGQSAYVETDRFEDLGFLEGFGFEVVAEAEVLHAPNWFMFRRADGANEVADPMDERQEGEQR